MSYKGPWYKESSAAFRQYFRCCQRKIHCGCLFNRRKAEFMLYKWKWRYSHK